MSVRVLKWSVPVDDQPHKIGTGQVVHVACQHSPESVQIWTVEIDEGSAWKPVQVFGTGHPIPTGWAHIGSTVTADGALVWHVFEAPPEMWGPDQAATQ